MTDSAPDDDPRKRWWGTMRRAYDAGPLDDDDTASAFIHRGITRDNGAFFGLNDAVAVTAMVTAVLDIASSGELDRLIAVEEPLYPAEAALAHENVYNSAHERGWPNITDPGTLMGLRAETDKMMDFVVARARAER